MAGKSNFLEKKLLDHVLRNVSYTPPAAVYCALFTTMPAEDSTGGVEVSGGAYARQAITFSAAADPGTTSNSADVLFPICTAGYGTVVGFGIFDASSAGNLLYFNTLTGGSVAFLTNDRAVFYAGQIVVTED